MEYRKKPVVIEATQWFKNGDHPLDNSQPLSPDSDMISEGDLVRRFRSPNVAGNGLCGKCVKPHDDHGWIETLEGGHIVCPGDFIITGVQGEKYPCKPDIFEETYETV